jgi:hypothetical protein
MFGKRRERRRRKKEEARKVSEAIGGPGQPAGGAGPGPDDPTTARNSTIARK